MDHNLYIKKNKNKKCYNIWTRILIKKNYKKFNSVKIIQNHKVRS